MGMYTDDFISGLIADALNAPTIAAATGYYLLDDKDIEEEPMPVIGWRVGSQWTMAVTPLGIDKTGGTYEHYTLGPDGKVRRHFMVFGGYVPTSWDSIEEWKNWHRDQFPTDNNNNKLPSWLKK